MPLFGEGEWPLESIASTFFFHFNVAISNRSHEFTISTPTSPLPFAQPKQNTIETTLPLKTPFVHTLTINTLEQLVHVWFQNFLNKLIAKKDSNSSMRVIDKPHPHVGAKQPLKKQKKTLTTNNGKVELTEKEKINS